MPVHSRRLGGPATVSNVAFALYVCPAGRTAIVKHFGLVTDNPLTSNISFGIGGIALGSQVARFRGDNNALPDGRRQFIVIREGETLFAQASSATAWVVSAHGYELVGVPV